MLIDDRNVKGRFRIHFWFDFVFVSMTLQGLVFQLDIALESLETQRNGIIFIYDMTESKYSNFDYELSVKILHLLKVSTRSAA